MDSVVVFFTLTDRASTIPSNTRGCQSGTWSAGQKKIRGTSTIYLSPLSDMSPATSDCLGPVIAFVLTFLGPLFLFEFSYEITVSFLGS